ncbi:MAG: hypothetical protein JNM55_10645 [Anaerolineales bacterium]|nr:hypothetical protein [Anaerolineales bacterium]
MPFTVEKEKREHSILYKIAGENSLQNFIELADEIYSDSIELHVSNFILDCRGIRGALEIGDMFKLGNYFTQKLKFCKLAGINTPADWHNNKFSENVVRNRGGKLEHFQTLEDAERWLSKI